MKISPKLIDIQELFDYLLPPSSWQHHCSLVAKIIPSYPGPARTPERVLVMYTRSEKTTVYLRYSKGPKQGYFWDLYGDDFQTPTLAIFALTRAPAPPRF